MSKQHNGHEPQDKSENIEYKPPNGGPREVNNLDINSIRNDFESIFDIPDFLHFNGTDYVYHQKNPSHLKQCQNVQDQWRGFKTACEIKEDQMNVLKKDLNTGVEIVNKQIKKINCLTCHDTKVLQLDNLLYEDCPDCQNKHTITQDIKNIFNRQISKVLIQPFSMGMDQYWKNVILEQDIPYLMQLFNDLKEKNRTLFTEIEYLKNTIGKMYSCKNDPENMEIIWKNYILKEQINE